MNANILWSGFVIVPPEQNKWNLIKGYRNGLLAQSDWTQLSDAVLTLDEKSAWQDYRQTLRDIPQDFTVPEEVLFPTPPNEVII